MENQKAKLAEYQFSKNIDMSASQMVLAEQ